MQPIDEKIIGFIQAAEKAKENRDITAGPIKIGQRMYQFIERDFFQEKLFLYLPEDFEEMDKAQREIKYPAQQRPQIIKTDETGSVNITLNPIDEDLDEDGVKELTKGMKNIIKRVNPANVFYSDGVERVGEKNIGFFEFKSPALDEFIYNIMFFFALEGKLVMGTFSCRYAAYEDWRDIAFQIIKSIRTVE
ncbi:hypothetical protein [Alkaliphilus crotonatoxidans]